MGWYKWVKISAKVESKCAIMASNTVTMGTIRPTDQSTAYGADGVASAKA